MRRVAMIVLSQYPGDPRVRREAEALGRAGIPVDVICYRNPDQPAREQIGTVRVHRIMRVRDKTTIVRYLFFSQGFGFAAAYHLTRLWQAAKPAVVQVHNLPDHLVFAALVPRACGTPVVLDLHDLTVELFESKWSGGKARALIPLVKLVERASCAFASRLITTSVGFRDRLVGRGIAADKVTLVLNSADNNIFYRPDDGVSARDARRGAVLEAPRIVYHGTIAHRFGVHVLIEAIALLKQRGLRPILRLNGKYDSDYRRALEDLIAARGLAADVELGGYILHEEIREMLGDMDIGAIPYLQDSFMDLALSTKSFEYVAMGLPVVASRVASMTALFSDEALRFSTPGDAADLADQIEYFCRTPAAREAWPRQADREYAPIAWPAMEDRYVGLMTGLMPADGGREQRQ